MFDRWNYKSVGMVHVEVSNLCNAACPICARYINHSEVVKPELELRSVSLNEFKKWFPLDFVQKSQRWMFCGTNGDPLMAKDFFEILKYVCKNSEASIQINTNAGIRSPDFFVDIGNLFNETKKLNRYVIFSVDGLEDTNHIYRRNVKWDKVYNNMKAYGTTGAKSQWDFLVFKHNEHQITEAEQLSKDLGITYFISKRAFGFENGDYYSNIPVHGKNLEYLYSIDPPSDPKNRNPDVTKFKEQIVHTIDISSIKKRSKDELISSWQDKIDRDLKNYKFPDRLSGKKVSCKSRENYSDEIYVDATGNVLPCCYVGTWYNGEYEDQASLQIRKSLYEFGLERINLQNFSLKEILDSGYLHTCFSSKWSSKAPDLHKMEFCFNNCGGDAGIDRLYNKEFKNVF